MKKLFTAVMACTMAFAAQAVTVDELCGSYDWNYISLLSMDYGKKNVKVEITPGTRPGTVVIKGMYLDYGFVADVNEKENTVSLREQFVDFDFTVNQTSKFFNTHVVGEGTEYVEGPIVAVYDDGKLIFDKEDTISIGFPNYDENGGMYYMLATSNVMEPAVDRTFVYNEDEWQTAGTGYLVDGWLSYHYFGDDMVAEYDVDMYVNKEDPNVYLIKNPYANEVWAGYNQDQAAEGYIVFDISNPEFVKFRTHVYCGFTDSEFGKLYLYAEDTHQFSVNGFSEEQVMDLLGATMTTYQDNIVYVVSPTFGTEARPTGYYVWGNMMAEIHMPDTSGIANSSISAECEAEYYNLQGVRISEPAKGLYIERRGGTAKKVVK